jgi:hypothetical protein
MKPFLENTLLLMQSLWYLAGITLLILLAVWFHQDVQSQRAAHDRAEVRHDQLLYESRQALLDHQRAMERLNQPR